MIKPGLSSSSTDLEDFSLLMALLTTASEIGAIIIMKKVKQSL
jgi:hypothetical protein